MHQYKVHLPQQNVWDSEDTDTLESFFLSGINRDQYNPREEISDISVDNLDLDE